MIEREKHINTIIENLILSQSPITDSIKASKIEVLEESKMAGIEIRSGDFAGAEMPSLSVLPTINVTPFSGKDQDAGRWKVDSRSGK
ncbi:hypothetical protein HI914_05083 [Erysiphe necator]|nr:hypothetical protein HI914_05083 [Erysiphe necator]